MLWLALALVACNPPLPEAVDTDAPDTDPTDTDTDADTDTDPGDTDDVPLELIFGLSAPTVTPTDSTNGWNPGETVGIEVTITNLTSTDQLAYPGVQLSADEDLVFVQAPSEFDFFGILANESQVATFTVEADPAIPVDTVVTFTAIAVFMNCTETTAPPCPDPNPITFAVTIQAP